MDKSKPLIHISYRNNDAMRNSVCICFRFYFKFAIQHPFSTSYNNKLIRGRRSYKEILCIRIQFKFAIP